MWLKLPVKEDLMRTVFFFGGGGGGVGGAVFSVFDSVYQINMGGYV